MLLVLFIPTWSKLSANDLHLGTNLQLGYIPVEASPLKKGSYNYYGIYISAQILKKWVMELCKTKTVVIKIFNEFHILNT